MSANVQKKSVVEIRIFFHRFHDFIMLIFITKKNILFSSSISPDTHPG